MRLFAVAVACTLAGASPTLAQTAEPQGSGFYLAGKGGPTFALASGVSGQGGGGVEDDSASNLIGAFGLAGGYAWVSQGLPLRTELEFMNRTEVSYNASPVYSGGGPADSIGSDIQNVTLMAKGYWHFDAGSPRWSPFVSAGLGVSRNAVTGRFTPAGGAPVDVDKTKLDLAWSLGTGASFYLGNRVVNDVELRYVSLGASDWSLPAPFTLESDALHAVELSFAIRMNF
jgi:opacity protein-like surface antigen